MGLFHPAHSRVGFFFSSADKILVKGQKSKEFNVQFSMLNQNKLGWVSSLSSVIV